MDSDSRFDDSTTGNDGSARSAVQAALLKKSDELLFAERPVLIARWLGLIFHPVILTLPVALAITVHEYGKSQIPVLLVSFLAFIGTFAVPMGLVYVMLREGLIGSDVTFSNQSNRNFVYPAIVVGLAMDWWLFTYVVPFEVGAAMSACGVATVSLLLLGNLFTKVSFHTAGVACILMMGVMMYGKEALILTPALPLIMWARVTSRNHTVAQVSIGSVIGIVCVAAVISSLYPQRNKLTPESVKKFKQQPIEYWLPFSGQPKAKL